MEQSNQETISDGWGRQVTLPRVRRPARSEVTDRSTVRVTRSPLWSTIPDRVVVGQVRAAQRPKPAPKPAKRHRQDVRIGLCGCGRRFGFVAGPEEDLGPDIEKIHQRPCGRC